MFLSLSCSPRQWCWQVFSKAGGQLGYRHQVSRGQVLQTLNVPTMIICKGNCGLTPKEAPDDLEERLPLGEEGHHHHHEQQDPAQVLPL